MHQDRIPVARILVVDDESLSRLLMDRMLKRDGHEVIFAETGKDALQQFNEKRPDLVFMDVMMGDMSGYDVARQIKIIDVNSYVPIIFLTSLSDRESLVQALESGGDDFITKPFHYEILKAKVRAALRTRSAYKKIQKQDAEVKLLHERLQWEQDVTENIFRKIIGESQPSISGFRNYLSPAALSCGDFVLASGVDEATQLFHFIIGDFTGHGLSAAIGTLPVSNWFNEFVSEGRSIQEIAYLLNNNLKMILPVSHFCAISLFQLDMARGELQVINAGLPDILVVSESEGITKHIHSNRLPLGIMEQEIGEFTPQFHYLDKGERLFAYTDGIIEATDILGEMFGSGRLKQIFENNTGDEWFDKIIEEVDDFQSKQYQRDDITLVEITFQPELYPSNGVKVINSDSFEYVSVSSAAKMLDVSENMLRCWIANGVIESTRKRDDRIVIQKKDIYQIIQNREECMLTHEGEKVTIVLVEDDPALLEISSGLIDELELGINLISVTNGYEALLRIGQSLPDIVITDLMMPDMNGFELIKSIRNSDKDLKSKIIAATALTSKQIDDKGGLADDVLILEKPFTISNLRKSIDNALAQ